MENFNVNEPSGNGEPNQTWGEEAIVGESMDTFNGTWEIAVENLQNETGLRELMTPTDVQFLEEDPTLGEFDMELFDEDRPGATFGNLPSSVTRLRSKSPKPALPVRRSERIAKRVKKEKQVASGKRPRSKSPLVEAVDKKKPLTKISMKVATEKKKKRPRKVLASKRPRKARVAPKQAGKARIAPKTKRPRKNAKKPKTVRRRKPAKA